jgi:hypothetical protein
MNGKLVRHIVWGLLGLVAAMPAAQAQKRPYVGYVYPAGGQQATTVRLKLGGQNLDDVNGVLVTGAGVSGRVVEYFRRIGNQEVQLLNEQLKELKPAPAATPAKGGGTPMMMAEMNPQQAPAEAAPPGPGQALIAAIGRRIHEAVQTPACLSIANLVWVEVTIAPGAPPGPRELRLVTARGISNPLPFHVGQVPETSREPMIAANLQVLGKEGAALRKRPPEEVEKTITLPCTVNGQIASGEVNRYRFQARKGQRLVLAALARALIPYVADAVPGWFQPVLTVSDAKGRELAYADDFRFRPDPVILFEVPADGEYLFTIRDAIYRGREDFVYRISVGELPFITSIFPLGGPLGSTQVPAMIGWGLDGAELHTLDPLVVSARGFVSNRVPFARDTLPELVERESNDTAATAQQVELPVIVNGRIDRPDDRDVFGFTGRANDPVVIEVRARRLDSPLDSVVRLTDAAGKVLAFNDDCEDLGAGTNTHHADSYLMTQLPADGRYFVHLGDTARHGGPEYGYRLRLGAPQPDFELRVEPSSVSLPLKGGATLSVHALRRDGFSGPIKLALANPPPGFTGGSAVIPANQTFARLYFKSGPEPTAAPVPLTIVGSANTGAEEITREAVPAEDRMQAFLWRHLVPASELPVLVYDPKIQPQPKRTAPFRPLPLVGPPWPVPASPAAPGANPPAVAKPKFTPQQIAGRLRQLKLLYQEGLLTDAFYDRKVTECEEGL